MAQPTLVQGLPQRAETVRLSARELRLRRLPLRLSCGASAEAVAAFGCRRATVSVAATVVPPALVAPLVAYERGRCGRLLASENNVLPPRYNVRGTAVKSCGLESSRGTAEARGPERVTVKPLTSAARGTSEREHQVTATQDPVGDRATSERVPADRADGADGADGADRLVADRAAAGGAVSQRRSSGPPPRLPSSTSVRSGVLVDVSSTRGNPAARLSSEAGGVSLESSGKLDADGAPHCLAKVAAACTSMSAGTAATAADIDANRWSPGLRGSSGGQGETEYMKTIYRNMLQQELQQRPDPEYMEKQTHINVRMRAILVDWLIEVHRKYKLRPETLHLAVSLMDLYLSQKRIVRRKFQLLGTMCLLLASKFEEVDPPKMADFAHITDKSYTMEDMIKFECALLRVLGFRVSCPTPLFFLSCLEQRLGVEWKCREAARYALEAGLLDLRLARFSCSEQAAAALQLAYCSVSAAQPDLEPCWRQELGHHCPHRISECASLLRVVLESAPTNKLQAVYQKYRSERHGAVAKCFHPA